jgi:hypothetical protein
VFFFALSDCHGRSIVVAVCGGLALRCPARAGGEQAAMTAMASKILFM